jgi:hypothetical protein
MGLRACSVGRIVRHEQEFRVSSHVEPDVVLPSRWANSVESTGGGLH